MSEIPGIIDRTHDEAKKHHEKGLERTHDGDLKRCVAAQLVGFIDGLERAIAGYKACGRTSVSRGVLVEVTVCMDILKLSYLTPCSKVQAERACSLQPCLKPAVRNR